MALFSLKKIGELAANHRTYLRGIETYNAGRVQEVRRREGDFYAELLTARVYEREPDSSCLVTVGFGDGGDADYIDCSCPAFREQDGACRHIVAALVHKYYADMAAGLRIAPGVPHTAEYHTDTAARRMMDAYVTEGAVQQLAAAEDEADKVDLLPTLQRRRGQLTLSFSLAGRRQYVLRDIGKFCADMREGNTVAYGRHLQLLHHPDSFTAESRPLLDFLLGRYGDEQAVRGAAGQSTDAASRELLLTPGALDEFFALYEGHSVLFREGDAARSIRLKARDPKLSLTLSEAAEKGGFSLLCDDIACFSGSRYSYVLTGETLCRCTPECSRQMAPLFRALQAGHGKLFIARTDMAEFCGSVLPSIRPYVQADGCEEQLTAYLPLPLEVEVYLDAPDSNTITAKVLCSYGEEKINPYGEAKPSTDRRDRIGETRARLVLQRHFPHYDPDLGVLVLRGDDDAIYRFLTDGAAEIGTVAAVYATDAYRNIGIDPPPRVSVGVSLNSRLLDLTIDTDGIDPEELGGVLEDYRRGRRFHRLKTGRYVTLDESALAGLAQIADGLALTDRELRTGRISAPKYRAMYLDRVLRENERIQFKRDSRFKELVKSLHNVSENDFPVPASLDGVLRNYQKTGHRWLKTLEHYGFGGILADDMGLGKTLEVISLLLDARESGNDLPSLVVCPASLVLNWAGEIARFAPLLTVMTVLGTAEQRQQTIRQSVGYDVVITSYDLLKRDIEFYQGREFRYHILDEAQYIKNHSTQNAKAVKAIVSRQRFALTGTPIENRLSELWSIFDFLMPGFLYSYTRFRERFEIPIVRGGNTAALERLGRMTEPFILRRLKQEVLRELPPKSESIVRCALYEEQQALYRSALADARNQLRHAFAERGFGGSHITVLAVLTRLRQLCCDPALCREDYAGGSAKLDSCMELLHEAAAGGHKVLLFSQFTSMLERLETRIAAEGLRSCTLRGSTPKEQRAALVESFNQDDTDVFLISLKAGGTGLNLTGADIVIHYDPWWNLAAQNQATDRAHRIGQTHSVQVYKLIASDTVEDRILRLQEEKQRLSDAILPSGDSFVASLTPDQLLELLE